MTRKETLCLIYVAIVVSVSFQRRDLEIIEDIVPSNRRIKVRDVFRNLFLGHAIDIFNVGVELGNKTISQARTRNPLFEGQEKKSKKSHQRKFEVSCLFFPTSSSFIPVYKFFDCSFK